MWHLTWHSTICCGCQQTVKPFDRWIRALLASTKLKADGHMTSGLVLTQLKEGGRLGAYHHMLPYLLPLGVFPFLFHSQFSCCLSNLVTLITRHLNKDVQPVCFISNQIFPFIYSFLCKLTRVSMRHNHLCVKRIWTPLTHVSLTSKPMLQSALHPLFIIAENTGHRIFYLAVLMKMSCTRILSWAVPNSHPSGNRDH